ncbi:MAG TPA: excinuclease ABC subunit UvrA [Candidatus Paceibacterota bacterium]|nr:excinuclease ABC subunit UvrA [Candidatus Paceibacterota bacterium]HRU33657.1 excinuclease ABC subunit UvrA [Candidatus Paceibacterota bacterium]
MKEEKIKIIGARTHNLKNINLELPKNKLIVFTGLSGSGKSSLAFDTLFAEGQRKYIESLSPYARQFLGQMEKPDVDDIEGLSPAIAINQRALSHNPRSIVATLTEIYDYLRVLFARIGKPYCPICGTPIEKLSPEEIFNLIINKAKELKLDYVTILSPVVYGRKGEYYQLLYDYLNKGFAEAVIDGKLHSLHDKIVLSRYKIHNIEIVIDRPPIKDSSRLFEAIEMALDYSNGLIDVSFPTDKELHILYSNRFSCPKDGFSFPEIEPRLFSFNSPYGACPTCHGLGKEDIFLNTICPDCQGKRLKNEALAVKVANKNIWEIVTQTIEDAYSFFFNLEEKLTEKEKKIAHILIDEILSRLGFLLEVGLDYLTLSREAETLSGGEAQRIRLASQLGSKLSNTLYVLDEPTIGLHERDTEKLLKTLKKLKELNNTVIVVEHDERTIASSDYFVELGPGAGVNGGEVVVAGETQKVLNDKKIKSLTLEYLRHEREIPHFNRRTNITEKIKIIGCRLNNLKNVDVEIPLRKLIAVTGVSGSGKSSLLEVIKKSVNHTLGRFTSPLEYASKIFGTEYVRRIVEIDQSPIGRTPRSNPATYTGVFNPIRDFFASLEDARSRGYTKSRFSFNVKGGRCEACEGAGYKLIEMHFLPPILVQCEVCRGKRFNRETLEVKYNKKNIADVLELTVDEAYEFFEDIYPIEEKLKILKEMGLGYIKLGQSATTLSGGEAQRIKLAKELSQTATKTIYLLDEPTVGLHYYDIELLLKILEQLVDRGNTVLVVEHNLHFINACDYIIDLGPEGGDKGGRIVATGTPEEIMKHKNSYTGFYLKKLNQTHIKPL